MSIYRITEQTESGGRDFNPDGSWVTSPKGARGRMQVMPGTERDPGYGVTPARDNSPEELARVGRDYLDAMIRHFGGDIQKGWAAYNLGPGKVGRIIEQQGNNWFSALPEETRNYVNKNMGQLRRGGGAGNTTADLDDPGFWTGKAATGGRSQDVDLLDSPDFWTKGVTPKSPSGSVNASRVLPDILPGAVVTSGYRGPNHPLSKANPNSWHARSHGAVDIKPIPGMTFEQARRQIEAQGYTIIEAKNEVGAGRSAHATGDHWHFVLAGGDQGADLDDPSFWSGSAKTAPTTSSFDDPNFWRG
jgi:hypothetical protein